MPRVKKEPIIWIVVKDTGGNVVRKIKGKNKKGFNRTSWNLTYPDLSAIDSEQKLKQFHLLQIEYRIHFLMMMQIEGV